MRVRPLVLALLAVLPLQAVAQAPPWHLDRLNQRALPLDGNALPFFPKQAEPDVTAHLGQGGVLFVMGAPIPSSSAEFGSRLQGGVPPGTYTHESLMASIAAGDAYGIAKLATIQSLQAVDSQGYAYWPDEVAGFNKILAYLKTHKGQPAVLLFSYSPIPGGPIKTSSEDVWFGRLKAAGVNAVVAAGNFNGADACQSWKIKNGIVVGAVDASDTVRTNSSTGKCVLLWAPGENTVSAFATSSGSSDSAAMTAGVLLSIRSQFPWLSPSSAQNVLFANADQGSIKGNLAGAANRLLFYSGKVTETLTVSAKQSGKTLVVTGRAALPTGLAGSTVAWVYRGRPDSNGLCQGQGTQVKVASDGSFSMNKNVTAATVCVMSELGTVSSVPVERL
jgi:Subtilase family